MSRQEIQRLLGGYATGTLNEAEQSALFEAALEDQELFDALAKEQELREVLDDPAARQQLMAALGPASQPFTSRMWHWWSQPAGLALAAGLVVLLIAAGLFVRQQELKNRPEALLAQARGGPQDVMALPPEPKVFREPALPKQKQLSRLPAPPVLQSKDQAVSTEAAQVALAQGAAPQGAPAAGAAPLGFAPRKEPIAELRRALALSKVAGKAAVAYTLLRREAGGTYGPMPAGTEPHSGDSVRVRIEAGAAGSVYLFRREAGNGWKVVASQVTEMGQTYDLPVTGGVESDLAGPVQLLLMRLPAGPAGTGGYSNAGADDLVSQAQAVSRITIEFR